MSKRNYVMPTKFYSAMSLASQYYIQT